MRWQFQHPRAPLRLTGVVRDVEIQVKDLDQGHSTYKLNFADESAQPLGFEFQSSRIQNLSNIVAVPIDQVGTNYIADLTSAAITDQTSTSVTVDAGVVPPAGGGIEIRRSDSGWGPDNDRNLVGRFTSQTAALPRLSRVQDYLPASVRRVHPAALFTLYRSLAFGLPVLNTLQKIRTTSLQHFISEDP